MKGLFYFILFQLVFFTVFLGGCGIDSIAYLGIKDIPVYNGDSDNLLNFSAPSDPTYLYSGMIVYYRIYDSKADAISDKGLLDSRQGGENIPGSSIPYLENTLKYARVARYSLKEKTTTMIIPTIPENIIITNLLSIIQISGRVFIDVASSNFEVIEEDPDNDDVFELLRNIGYGSPSKFDEPPQPEDLDYQMGESEDMSYYVQFFTASYGFDLAGTSTELYSNAVYLGRIVLAAGG